ncbi:MAG: hypothetical protein IJR83_04775, partial [Clostridia bacterium]|nr:hypothetical protein [Clostridia bacterium]
MNRQQKMIKQKKIARARRTLIGLGALLACVICLFVSELAFGTLTFLTSSIKTYAYYNATSEIYELDSFQKLVDYSNAFTSAHANDTIKITFGDSDTSGELTGFKSIGTAENPFDGKIIIGAGMTLNLPTTMFGGITDDVAIVDTSDQPTTLVLTKTRVTENEPLFAKYVAHTRASGSADWRIHYDRYYNPENSSYYTYDSAGFIGTIGEDANVRLTLTYDNYNGSKVSKIVSTADAGLVCGEMENGAVLEIVSVSQTAGRSSQAFSISSTGTGNAGGLVGRMGDGSRLILGANLANIQGSGQTITAADGYAGGIVGYIGGGTVVFNNTNAYTVSQVITGTDGAGGIAGYCSTVQTSSQDALRYDVQTGKVQIGSTCKVNGDGDCGGLYGTLVNDGDMTIQGSAAVSPDHSAGDAETYGGMIGRYLAADLSDSLLISATGSNHPTRSGGTAAQYGGLVGEIEGASYVKFSGVTVTSSNATAENNFGGLAGRCAQGFMELTGTNTISFAGITTNKVEKVFAGIVGDLDNGVLYLQGSTDLSGTPGVSTVASVSGQIVGKRDYGLVFAANGWTLTRSSASQQLDDIGSWGEVIRFNSTNLIQGDVLTVNAGHYVTLEPGETAMSDLTYFAKTALNIQHNKGQNSGVLRCSGGSQSSTLRQANLSLSSSSVSIDLSGTGITGLTRDNGDSCVEFTGTFNGNGGKIKLAVGEDYFAGSNPEGNGIIYRHEYIGLFGKTSNASISNLSISKDSVINVKALTRMNVGNLVGQAGGGLTLDTVKVLSDTSDPSQAAAIRNAGGASRFGGFVGCISGAGTVSITNSTYQGKITGSAADSQIGGLIGLVSASDTFNITITDSTVSGQITATSGYEVGGTIGVIATSTAASSGRTVTLNGLTVDGLKMDVTGSSGGFLGHKWYKTDVVFSQGTGVTVQGNAALTSTGDTAGLVHTATGYWKVLSGGINLNSLSVTANSATSFGLLVNKGYYQSEGEAWGATGSTNSSAIYLELAPGAYTVTSGVALNIPTSGIVFDEIVAYSANGDVEGNGQGIVSIATENHSLLKMSDANTGVTYQHKTSFLENNASLRENIHTRYYYNLDAYRISPANEKEQLLVWSVWQYANPSIRPYFASNNTIGSDSSTDLNMRGYSYYPVDLTGTLTLKGKVCLYNNEFDTTESAATDSRDPDEASQHYLMHNGLFRNVSGVLNAELKFDGNVKKIDDYCGVLVMGTVSSTASANPATVTIGELVLDGIRLNETVTTSTDDLPLLINKAGSNAVISISGVSNNSTSYTAMGAGASSYIAGSLLGQMGDATASAVKLSFSSVKLDGRNAAGVTALSALDSVYHSHGSLFSRATLAEKLQYAANSGSFGVYNYTYTQDWGGSRNVTYGAEIDATLENRENLLSKQQKYSLETGVTNYYVRPDTDPSGNDTAYGAFGTNFINYVKTAYVNGGTTHELRVNIAATSFSGCGTYNDPYIITSEEDFNNIAKLINGTFPDGTFDICVPSSVTDSQKSEIWCTNKNSHTTYTELSSSSWTTGGVSPTTISNDTLREYLAGAYYMIDSVSDIVLTTFDGFSNNVSSQFAFRGVIEGGGAVIENRTTQPLIVSSNGSVVRNLTIRVKPSTTKTLNISNSKPFKPDGNLNTDRCDCYGAVIGQIFGGDNIIDNVKVDYSDTSKAVIKKGGNRAYLVPIGGYVGVVVNGGLIFRNMTGLAEDYQAGITAANLSGFDATDPTADSNTKWLYINPIVGRVLNGYAITESSTYKPFEDGSRTYPDGSKIYWHGTYADGNEAGKVGVTMRNGTKNYSIADIKTGAEIFTMKKDGVTSGEEGSTITVSNAQSLFIISLITESGLGTSANCKYDNANNILKPYTDYMATHLANYDHIGDASLPASKPTSAVASPATEADLAQNDAYSATKDIYKDNSSNSTKQPYLIVTYTPYGSADKPYPAFNLAAYKSESKTAELYLNLTFSDEGGAEETYYMPDGFRGLGALMLQNGTNTNWATNTRVFNAMFFENLAGNDRLVSLRMNLYLYNVDNYSTPSANQAFMKTGYGFFNALRSKEGSAFSNQLRDLTLSGMVHYDLFDASSGNSIAYTQANLSKNDRPAVGGFIGAPGVDTNTDGGGGDMWLENIRLNNLSVTGVLSAGGFFGCSNAEKKYTFKSCSADNLEVVGGISVGGMIGYIRNSKSVIVADFGGREFGIIRVVARCAWVGSTTYSTTGAGGLFGDNYAGNADGVSVSNVTIRNASSVAKGYVGYSSVLGNSDHVYAGGVIGCVTRESGIKLTNVTVANLDVEGKQAGGMIGSCSGKNPVQITDCLVTADEDCSIRTTVDDSTNSAAGGMIGCYNKTAAVKIIDSKVENYTVRGGQNCGGLVGRKLQNVLLETDNVSVSGVSIKTNSKGGGLVGDMNNGTLSGYNILTDDVTFARYSDSGTVQTWGYVAGRNESKTIKLVGFSRQGTISVPAIVGTTSGDLYGSGGYVIFADYDGTAKTVQNGEYANIYARGTGSKLTTTEYTIVVKRIAEGNTINGNLVILAVSSEVTKVDATGAYDASLGFDTQITQTSGTRLRYQYNKNSGHELREWGYASSSASDSLRYSGGAVTGPDAGASTYGTASSAEIGMYSAVCADYTGLYKDNMNCEAVELIIVTQTVKENIFDSEPPFVITNPKTFITGTQFLTGDGVSGDSYFGSAAQSIISGINTNKGYRGTGMSASEIETLAERLSSNMKTIRSIVSSQLAYDGEDLPVLMIDDLSTVNETVNGYLQLLTNTDYDFTTGYSDGSTYTGSSRQIFNVSITRWRYDSDSESATYGQFVKQNGEASLKCYVNDRFYITPTDVDNENWQFSLIDVQFYDPSVVPTFKANNTVNKAGKDVYHLYVPVIVKKMLHYTVEVRPASTTTYSLQDYPASSNNLLENLGNPITIKVTYTYRQTAQDWADAINAGESVYRNYPKSLDIKAFRTDEQFPDDAIIVLVDPNGNADSFYYGNFDYGHSGDVLLDKAEDAGSRTYKLKLDSTAFTGLVQAKINDLITVSLDGDAETKNLVAWVSGTDDPSEIVAVVNDGGTDDGLVLRSKKGSETGTYAVSIALKPYQNNGEYVQEHYYISLYTKVDPSDDEIYHFEVKSTGTNFGDPFYPSAKVGASEVPHLFLGNLFTNSVTITETNADRVMSDSNRTLSADLSASVGFTENAIEKSITSYIGNDNVKIYQTFMLTLNRLNGGDSNQRGILVDPSTVVPGSYLVNGLVPDDYDLDYEILSTYVVLTNDCDLKEKLKYAADNPVVRNEGTPEEYTDYTISISESVSMTYETDSLSVQFPASTAEASVFGSADTVGTYMIGYSNISSTSDGGAASRASVNPDDGVTRRLCYYIESEGAVSFSYSAVSNAEYTDD